MRIYDEQQTNIMLQEIEALKDKVSINLLFNFYISKYFILAIKFINCIIENVQNISCRGIKL